MMSVPLPADLRPTDLRPADLRPAGPYPARPRPGDGGERPGSVDPTLVSRARPVSGREDRLLPVLPALRRLVGGAGLQRGTVLTVGVGEGRPGGGATTLGFALLAAATTAGSWGAAVGTADPGIVALDEMGVDLDRLALVPTPGGAWAEVAAALVDEMDMVLVRTPGRVGAGVARRLVARVRRRQAVLVVQVGPGRWPEAPDVALVVEGGTWEGVDRGHGHLRGRRVEVAATGRRAAVRGIRQRLWLPSASGAVTMA